MLTFITDESVAKRDYNRLDFNIAANKKINSDDN